jgi:ribosomal protein S18 acetylase RimI-like enzyme
MIRETTCYDRDDILHLAACQSHEDQRYAGVDESFEDLYTRWKEKGHVTRYEGEIFHIVEERDGEIVGICGMSISTDGSSFLGDLTTMYVKPEYRRRGIALALLKRIVKMAKEKGVEFIFAWTRHEATAATALYEKAGMMVNIQPVYYLAMFEPRPASPAGAD